MNYINIMSLWGDIRESPLGFPSHILAVKSMVFRFAVFIATNTARGESCIAKAHQVEFFSLKFYLKWIRRAYISNIFNKNYCNFYLKKYSYRNAGDLRISGKRFKSFPLDRGILQRVILGYLLFIISIDKVHTIWKRRAS